MKLISEIEKVRDAHCDIERVFGDSFVDGDAIPKELFKEIASNNYQIRRLLTLNIALLEGEKRNEALQVHG